MWNVPASQVIVISLLAGLCGGFAWAIGSAIGSRVLGK